MDTPKLSTPCAECGHDYGHHSATRLTTDAPCCAPGCPCEAFAEDFGRNLDYVPYDVAAGARPAPGQLAAKREAVVACYRECIDALDRLDAMDHPQTSVDLFREALAEFEVVAMANGYRDGREVSALPGAAASGREDELLAKLERAHETVVDLCQGRTQWTMSIPARPDVDPDLIIGGALREAIDFLSSAPRPGGQAASQPEDA